MKLISHDIQASTSLLKMLKAGMVLKKNDFPDADHIRKSHLIHNQLVVHRKCYVDHRGIVISSIWKRYPMTRQGLTDALQWMMNGDQDKS